MSSMTKSIHRAAWAALLLFASATVAAAQGKSPQEILARYAKAIDPDGKIASAEGIRSVATMEMPGMGVAATMTGVQRRPNQMAMHMVIPGMGEMRQGFDGKIGWTMDPMGGPRLLTEEETKAVSDNADFKRMTRDPALYSAMEAAGEATVEGEAADCIKLTSLTARVATECFSRASGLLLESRATQPTPQGQVDVVTRYKDYKSVSGVMMPHLMVNMMMGMEQKITMTEVTIGPVDAKLFELPPEVAALKKP